MFLKREWTPLFLSDWTESPHATGEETGETVFQILSKMLNKGNYVKVVFDDIERIDRDFAIAAFCHLYEDFHPVYLRKHLSFHNLDRATVNFLKKNIRLFSKGYRFYYIMKTISLAE